MAAKVQRYFDLINNCRTGEVDPFVLYLTRSALHASTAAVESVATLDALPALWMELPRPRQSSSDDANRFMARHAGAALPDDRSYNRSMPITRLNQGLLAKQSSHDQYASDL
ncbi:hypothetical protein JOE40_000793 [Arthrobacter sp. PvP102]|jgi:hypothetical protein|uniref:hypothetical protein n=1 Tax=unclassified Arthrobacter TaxID=235627 RepID=UPI001AE9C416|nr:MULTISPECIES: hypothetical protein [unclassified Arthrobacter]MBP1235325.1 hypothetical protein [Arthrobacter sp. PvP103]MBP1236284.1 hypothetical protein [Arthrobacter sp. PvP102]